MSYRGEAKHLLFFSSLLHQEYGAVTCSLFALAFQTFFTLIISGQL